jgi:hypothetical protein
MASFFFVDISVTSRPSVGAGSLSPRESGS